MKPQNIKTAEQAKQFIENQGIEIIPNIRYSIYACGCVLTDAEDPVMSVPYKRIVKPLSNISKNSKKIRCCPIHFGQLISKFRQCSCEYETLFWGKRVRAVDHCRKCKYKKENAGKIVGRRKYNHLADPKRRSSCVHRNECLTKYDKFETIPCKGCDRYVHEDIMEDINKQGGRGFNDFSGIEILENTF